jgi:hypothetical protein
MLVRRLEVVGHLGLEIVVAVVGMHAAGLFGMGVDVDRYGIIEIGQLQFCHFGFPAGRLILHARKLIILYNKFRKAA